MEAPTLTWFWIFCSSLILTMVLSDNFMVSGNPEEDAIIAFKQSLSDPNNVLESWDTTLVNPCTWIYITCNQDQQVIRLDLGSKNLAGNLVPELGNLEHLQYLELFQNNIQGTIPAEFGNLMNLISMDLYDNNLSGRIPSSLGNIKSLTFLRLNDNHLTGQVPKEVSSLPNLRVLNVTNNDMGGPNSNTQPLEGFPLENMATPSLGFLKFVLSLAFLNVIILSSLV